MAPSFEELPTLATAPAGQLNGTKGTLTSIETPTYPTRSLHFLQPLNTSDGSDISTLRMAKVKLSVIIVGAGLGGLACAIALARRGHNVKVFEQATELGEVGAGIQIPSNSSRLLHSWGLEPFLKKSVVEPNGMSFRRWDSGKLIGYTKLVPDFRQNFKGPYYVIHRAHFHDALYQRALQLGVDVRIASRVEKYDLEAPSIQLANGEVIESDIIIAADGVNSTARKLVLGGTDVAPQSTGFAAYRATVDAAKMKNDPEISWLLDKPSLNIWIGPGRHVMTYTIAAGESFNLVLSHIDHTDPATWNPENAIKDMREHFSGWDPCLTRIIGMIDKTLKWPLLNGSHLERWVAPSSKMLIIGDAAHAMLPYMSQGAAMAVEDAAALAAVLSLIESPKQLPSALKLFETERKKRSGQMQNASLLNGKLWHFDDGPEQKMRDESMKPEVEGKSFSWSANQWSDPVTQWWAYGYDAEKEIENGWDTIQINS